MSEPFFPKQTWRVWWWPLGLPLLLLIILPLAVLLWRSSPADVAANLVDPMVRQALSLSLRTSAMTVLLVILLGTPLAWLLAQKTLPGKRIIEALLDLPIVLPPSVAGIALLITFGRRGLLGGVLELAGIAIPFTPVAVVLAQLFVSAPLYVKSAEAAFATIDGELTQSAALDGASDWQAMRFVIIPLTGPALLSGLMIAWARALGEFGATIIFAGNLPGRTQTMPLAIYVGFEQNFDLALTLAVILLGLSFLVLLLVRLVFAGRAR